jgi:orsellinic acid C2-O-methyltransferase
MSAGSPQNRPGPPADAVLLGMVNGFVRSQIIGIAARLSIADHLAGGPRSAEELASLTGTRADLLERVMRALASCGVFAETDEGRFALTDLSQALRRDAPRSVRDILVSLTTEETYQSVGQLEHTLRTGQVAFEHLYGEPLFDWWESHPDGDRLWQAAGDQWDVIELPQVLAACDFSRFHTVVDVGGNRGRFLAAILAAHPGLQGIVFDRPGVVEGASEVAASLGVADRLTTAAGDFFHDWPEVFGEVPSGRDAYILRRVLHDWDDDRARTILHNCQTAMTATGTLLVIERLAPPRVAPSPIVEGTMMIDMLMMALLGGRQRTEAEFRDLLRSAGMELTNVSFSPTRIAVLEARRLD